MEHIKENIERYNDLNKIKELKEELYDAHGCEFCINVSMFAACQHKAELQNEMTQTLNFNKRCEHFDLDVCKLLSRINE